MDPESRETTQSEPDEAESASDGRVLRIMEREFLNRTNGSIIIQAIYRAAMLALCISIFVFDFNGFAPYFWMFVPATIFVFAWYRDRQEVQRIVLELVRFMSAYYDRYNLESVSDFLVQRRHSAYLRRNPVSDLFFRLEPVIWLVSVALIMSADWYLSI